MDEGQNTFNYSITEDNKFVFLSIGSNVNYMDNGSFKLESKSMSVKNDILVVTVIDLETGEVLIRKVIEEKKSTRVLNNGYCEYNNQSKRYLVGIYNKSLKGLIKVDFSALSLE